MTAAIGAWFGVHIRDYTSDKTLRTIFALFMTIVAIRILTSL